MEADAIATIIICNIEGAMMMSKLEKDPVHLRRAIAHLKIYLQDSLQ